MQICRSTLLEDPALLSVNRYHDEKRTLRIGLSDRSDTSETNVFYELETSPMNLKLIEKSISPIDRKPLGFYHGEHHLELLSRFERVRFVRWHNNRLSLAQLMHHARDDNFSFSVEDQHKSIKRSLMFT